MITKPNLPAVIAVPLGLLVGLASAAGSVIAVGAVVGLALAVFLMFVPKQLFLTTLFFSMAISGVAEFYFGIAQANWIPSLLGFALLGAALLAREFPTRQPTKPPLLPSVSWLIFGYVLALFLASLLNLNSFAQWIVGCRGYLSFVGVYLALQTFANDDKSLRRWIHALLFIGLIQFPFSLHQALFVAPMREHSLAAVGGGAEAIVGSFGGNPLGGGYTGEMAVYVLIASLLALALAPVMRGGRLVAWTMCIFAIGCVAVAETKIVFVLAPIAAVLVFYEELRSSPKRMVVFLFVMAIVLGGLGAVYAWRFWTKGPDEFWHAFTYSFDPNFMVDRLHRGRIAALFHWWDNNIVHFDFLHAIFGYGMASTLETSRILGEGSAVKVMGLGLNSHAASTLLWDSGIIGFSVFCWVIARTTWNAHRLVGMRTLPEFHHGAMKATRATMFCFAAMLPYQVSVVGGAPMQFIFWFFIGYVEYWRRQVCQEKSCLPARI